MNAALTRRSLDAGPAIPAGVPSDDDLMELVRADHKGAFTTLVERHQGRVRRFLARMVGSADARDLAQDVFVQIWRARARYDARGRFLVYLYVTARNRGRSHLRWRLVRVRFAASTGAQSAHGEEDPIVDDRPDPALASALSALPLQQREAVLLRCVEDLSYEEMAQVVGAPVGTLRARVHRGLERLRRDLTPERLP